MHDSNGLRIRLDPHAERVAEMSAQPRENAAAGCNRSPKGAILVTPSGEVAPAREDRF